MLKLVVVVFYRAHIPQITTNEFLYQGAGTSANSLCMSLFKRINLRKTTRYNATQQAIKDDWYAQGVKFKCTGCGKCCTWKGNVFIDDEDIQKMSSFLHLTENEFTKKYVRFDKDERKFKLDADKNGDCFFFTKDKKCSIYTVKPKQCSTFPFWPDVLRSKDSWDGYAKFCEGMNHKEGTLVAHFEVKTAIK